MGRCLHGAPTQWITVVNSSCDHGYCYLAPKAEGILSSYLVNELTKRESCFTLFLEIPSIGDVHASCQAQFYTPVTSQCHFLEVTLPLRKLFSLISNEPWLYDVW